MVIIPSLNLGMHPTHNGIELLVGTDALGFHICIIKHKVVEMGPTKLHWHVLKFPLELYEGLRDIMDGKEAFATFDVGDFMGHLKEVEKDVKIQFTVCKNEDGFDFSIILNSDELLQLYNALKNHFCY